MSGATSQIQVPRSRKDYETFAIARTERETAAFHVARRASEASLRPKLNETIRHMIEQGRPIVEAFLAVQPGGPAAPSWVYFVGDDRRVKIGFTTQLRSRMRSLRREAKAHSSSNLHLLAFANGTQEDEQRLHEIFRGAQLVHEWFKKTPALARFIAGVRAATRINFDAVTHE